MAPKILLTSVEGMNLTLTVNSCALNFIRGYVGEITIFLESLGTKIISIDERTIRVECPNLEAVNAIKAFKSIEEI